MPGIQGVVVDTTRFERRLTRLQRQQLPFARSLAANQAAFETRRTIQTAMPLYIQNPTSHTIRGVLYRKGNKQSPAAEVYLNDFVGKGTPQVKYLRPLVRGGVRNQKASERVLQRAGFITQGEGWVPAAVRTNSRGNVSGAMITRILSGVKAFGESGATQNISAASRRRGRRKGRSEYFVARGSDHLRRGVWERYGRGRRQVRPVLLFVDLPSYRPQFPFYRLAERELRRRFARAWPQALRRALRTAR